MRISRAIHVGLAATAVLGFGAVVPVGAAPIGTGSPPLGVIMDNSTKKAVAFDPATNTVVGSVAVGGANPVGDCSIIGGKAFATTFTSVVRVIDLATSPPALAAGTNSIPISNKGEDIDFTPKGLPIAYVSDGGAIQPLSVLDTSQRKEVTTASTGKDNNSVAALVDGSVLTTSAQDSLVHRLVPVAGAKQPGTLVVTPNTLSVAFPGNLAATPANQTAIVVGNGGITSFDVPGLTYKDSRSIGGSSQSAAVTPDGARVLVRTNSSVVAFSYNQSTGAIGAAPLYTVAEPTTNPVSTYYGIDLLVISSNGSTFYVGRPNAVDVRRVSDGSLITSIVNADIVDPTGICLP